MLAVRELMSDEQTQALLAMRAKYTAAGPSETDVSSTVASVSRGRQVFAQCALCHSGAGDIGIAPDLNGVIGGAIANDPSYERYSPALKAYATANGTWSEGRLDRFLASPQTEVPGTYMAYSGLKQPADRAAIIAYLETLSD